MMRTRVFHEINGIRLSSKMQCRAKSIKNPFRYETKNKNEKSIEDIPGPKALPLIGNLFRFMPFIGEYYNVNVLTLMQMLRAKYGNIVKLDGTIKEQPKIFLFCPKLFMEMYQSQGKWPCRNAMEPLHYYRKSREHIYNGQYGLVTSQGELWYNFRSKVNPYLIHPNIVQTYTTQICEITSELVENMRVLRDPKTLELPNNFINELHKWSLESMCSIALNCRMGCLRSNLSVNSEPQIMINCVQEVFNLIYRLENLPSLWKVYDTQNVKKLFRNLDTINKISERYIEYAKTKFLETTDNTTNLEDRSLLNKLLSIDKQTAHVMALDILMSTDTTSNAAGGLLYYIANNVKKQEKLREEVMSVLPDKTTPITHDILKKALYTKACIKESLRLFPIASAVLRTMQKEVRIGGYAIPKGSNIMACHGLLSMDSTYFPGSKEFIPERWLRNCPEFLLWKKSHPFVYMPFGYGNRNCIGQRLAEMKLQIILLKVIRNFLIEWHYGPLEYKSQIVNTVTSPLRFKIIEL